MYYINLTEIFRERQLALLEEAEHKRLARRVRVPKVRVAEHLRRLWASWLRSR